MKTFADFLASAKIEDAASREKFDEDARQPLDELLRLGTIAGPLACVASSKSTATFKPLPGTPFDWGKVKPDSDVHVAAPGEVYSALPAPPKGRLTPEDAPNCFNAKQSLSLTGGSIYVFPPTRFDSTSQILKILKAFPATDSWPAPAAASPSAAPSSSAYDRAFAACLDDANPILAIKGPPGTGKTDLLADVALALTAKGKKVAIITVSHAAVNNALSRSAEKAANPTTIIFKHGGADPNLSGVTHEKISGGNLPQIWGSVIASASHMYEWSKQEGSLPTFKHGTCDVLLIDEAGQVPAYEAAALSKLATRMILFGDEDQLPNICHGQHPPGSHGDSSAMRYLRDVLPELAIPLEVSHRMNRTICGLIQRHFYPDIALQTGKNADSHLIDNGTRFPALIKDDFPHPHPRLSRSEKEAARVVEWVQRLLAMQAAVEGEQARPMTTADIAILTPFRAHASAIKAALAKTGIADLDKLRLGTVDKMQGQGAAAVIYSLASSSKDYIAAQTEWLLSSNRWNVALSRAIACAIVVGDFTAHLTAVPKALDGIAAQAKIRGVMEDAAWEVR